MVFSPDINIGSSALAQKYDLNGKLLVHSIFATFQGEMPYGGYAAVFLRLGGCNRGAKAESCKFCDTAFELHDSRLLTIRQTYDEIVAATKKGTSLLVVTGGEPLMQQDSLNGLFELLEQDGIYSQIETNGDFSISEKNKFVLDSYIVCSPKAWDGIQKPFKSLSLKMRDITAYRFLIDSTQIEYQSVPEVILSNIIIVGERHGRPLFLSPITVYKPDSSKEERNKGWGGTAINVHKTIKNYQHAVKIANDLLDRGYTVRLSSQSHLLFGIA
jgi:7-carboxy-7-deazaguanine synthase